MTINKRPHLKMRGRQGSWLIEVPKEDGAVTRVPSAHARFLNAKTMEYRRDDDDMARYPGKLAEWNEALRATRMVVLTRDDWTKVEEPPFKVERREAIALWSIDDLVIDGARHSFRLINRLAEAK